MFHRIENKQNTNICRQLRIMTDRQTYRHTDNKNKIVRTMEVLEERKGCRSFSPILFSITFYKPTYTLLLSSKGWFKSWAIVKLIAI